MLYVSHFWGTYLDFQALIKSENNVPTDYSTFSDYKIEYYEKRDPKLYDCFKEINKMDNKQYKDYKENKTKLIIDIQMEEWNKIVWKYYPNANIKYVKINSTEEVITYLNRLKTAITIPEVIEKNVIKTFENNKGNGLYNAGLYNNIKDFINFRKDTKETLYYLLQRIIKLENDMKTVKNKIVSNDIRTNLRNNNINLSDEEEDENRGNGFAYAQNNFTCSRCGMINPKFFKNDYPTLSEFREQFSKL